MFKAKHSSKDFNGIEVLEKINIGGIDQWVSIRSNSLKNPILLFLHGGPGSSEMSLVNHFNSELEKYFIVVNWDQRGAGRSYSARIPKESMNIEQFISDTYELVLLLRNRFHKERLLLVGHSWGSVLGVYMAQKYPELFHAYIGIGQEVNGFENEIKSFEYTLQMASKTKNKKAIRELQKIGNPPSYLFPGKDHKWLWNLKKQRGWLVKFGGSIYGETSYVFTKYEIRKISDLYRFIFGNIFSMKALWKEEIETIDLESQAQRFDIPIYFITGKHDYQTPFELTERYFNLIKAPEKYLVWFDNSAHSPIYEEPEQFNNFLINKVLPKIID